VAVFNLPVCDRSCCRRSERASPTIASLNSAAFCEPTYPAGDGNIAILRSVLPKSRCAARS